MTASLQFPWMVISRCISTETCLLIRNVHLCNLLLDEIPVSRRIHDRTCSTETLITTITSITEFKRLLSLASHLQMKTCQCGKTCCSAALSLTLYKTAFLLRLSSFSRKELIMKNRFKNNDLISLVGLQSATLAFFGSGQFFA